MMMNDSTRDYIYFGPFKLSISKRLLLKNGEPVRIGSRALDLLIVLVSRPGELISKRELLDSVWPGAAVVDANLNVNLNLLRRALGDGRHGARYIVNSPGQGYRFVAPLSKAGDRHRPPNGPERPPLPGHMPARLTRLIGRCDLAESLRDFERLTDALLVLWRHEVRLSNYKEALALARRIEAVAEQSRDDDGRATSETLLGLTLYALGETACARPYLRRAIGRDASAARPSELIGLGIDQKVAAQILFANLLWLQGFPTQSLAASASALEQARASGWPIAVCIALVWRAMNMLLCGAATAEVEDQALELLDLADQNALALYYLMGQCLLGICHMRRGDFAVGESILVDGLEGLDKAQHHLLRPFFVAEFGRLKLDAGQPAEALAAVRELERAFEARAPVHFWTPELLRVRGEVLRAGGHNAEAEQLFLKSLNLARRQQTLSWELRSAIGLARHWRTRGREAEARDLLAWVYGRFSEGFETQDLKAAKQLMDELMLVH